MRVVADDEDAGMFALQLAFGNEAIDGVIGDPGLAELMACDAAALMTSDLANAFVLRPRNGDRRTRPQQFHKVCPLIPENRG